VAAAALGYPQRHVDGPQQPLGIVTVAGDQRHPERRVDGRPAVGAIVVVQRGQQRLGERLGILGVDDRRELVAPQAPDHGVRADGGPQARHHRAQQGIAGGMTGGLVDLTEVVEIDEQQGGGASAAGDPVQPMAKRGARERAGQIIVVGVVARLVEHLAQLLGDATTGQEQRDRRQAQTGVARAHRLEAHDRHRQCNQQHRPADPVRPAAAGEHAAGHGGQPQERERGHDRGAEADDQHPRDRGQRLLHLYPLLARRQQLHDRADQDDAEADPGQRRRGARRRPFQDEHQTGDAHAGASGGGRSARA
jgi:hypothetical protein